MSGQDPIYYKNAIKSVMKMQKKSYADLAEVLGVSLVTVKRFLSKEEISLSRLIDICNWLELSLSDLEKIAIKNLTNTKNHFNEKQEKFLAQNPEYLAFLFNLYANETPESIQKKQKLSAKSLNLYLIRLEKYELIKKQAGKYKPTYKDFPSPLPYGELIKSNLKNVLETGFTFFSRYNSYMRERKNSELDKGSQTSLAVMSISRGSYLSWFEKYKILNQELLSIANIEEKIDTLKDKQSLVVMHLSGLLPENHIEVETIKNMFGRVIDIN